ncbi:MAG: hypothetical protein AAF907_08780, partial [Planctomycetota bacterium]
MFSLSLLDENRVRLTRLLSPAVNGTSSLGGKEVEIGPVPPAPGAVWAVVGCHLTPGENVSVGGDAWFDDVTLMSEPHLSLTLTDAAAHPAPDGTVGVRVQVSGVPYGAESPALTVTARNLNESGSALTVPLFNRRQWDTGVSAEAEIGPLTVGLWEITASTAFGGAVASRTLRTVVADPADLPPRTARTDGRFGLTLAAAPDDRPDRIAEQALAAGVGWVRWTAGDASADEGLAAALRVVRLRPVVQLTAENFDADGAAATADAIEALPNPLVWLTPQIQPLAVHVRHWQVGQDDEPAALGGPYAPSAAGLFRAVAPGVTVAGPAETGADLPVLRVDEPGSPAAWRTLRRAAAPDEFLWSLLLSAAAGDGPVFTARPVGTGVRVLDSDGSPGFGYLPFRTAAALLGDGRFLGRLRLPDLSERDHPEILVFQTSQGAVLALRGERSGAANVRLGGAPAGLDPIHRPFDVEDADGGRHRLAWSPEPRFVHGASLRLLRLRLSVEFLGDGVLQSSPEPQTLTVRFLNASPSPRRFLIRLELPPGWETPAGEAQATVPANSFGSARFTVLQPEEVSLGEHPVAVIVTPRNDPPMRIPRRIEVELAGLRLDVADRELPGGGWEVIQTLVNELPDGSKPAFR